MIKKFHAATTRDALRQVRDALGADAIILSNRQVDGGIEIIAVADLDISALAGQAQPQTVRPPQPQPVSQRPQVRERPSPPPPPQRQPTYAPPQRQPTYAPPQRQPAYAPPQPPAEPEVTTFTDYIAQREASVIRPAPARRPPPQVRPPSPSPQQTPQTGYVSQPDWNAAEPTYTVAPPQAKPVRPNPPQAPSSDVAAPVIEELAREMHQLRVLMEGQLVGLAWNDTCRREPHRAELMKELMAAGFSPALSRQILDRTPPETDMERARKWIRAAIVRNLKVAENADELIDRGGIYALVGPTGVGKTTTVAKLAARAVLRHGASRVAMITADSYRIGAQDQLRIYGRILGTPVFAVRDENELELSLVDLQNKHLVFIDTIGMSQKDQRVGEQTKMLSGQDNRVKRLLLLGAPSQGITLEEVVRAYGGPGLAGCILTKIDEAQVYGTALDVVIRHQIRVHYVTNGQRVPEDLHLANAGYLVDRAFRQAMASGSAFLPEDDDFPLLMAATERQPDKSDDAFTDFGAYGATA